MYAVKKMNRRRHNITTEWHMVMCLTNYNLSYFKTNRYHYHCRQCVCLSPFLLLQDGQFKNCTCKYHHTFGSILDCFMMKKEVLLGYVLYVDSFSDFTNQIWKVWKFCVQIWQLMKNNFGNRESSEIIFGNRSQQDYRNLQHQIIGIHWNDLDNFVLAN